jgi:nicotinic acid mononucleotide adenylyltransferase
VGTFDLLDLLTTEEQDTEFTFCMGADTFTDLTDWKWKRSKDVMRLLEGRIIVFQRQIGGDCNNSDDISSMLEKRVCAMNSGSTWGTAEGHVQIVRLNGEARDNVSSTQIRSITLREELKGLVTPQVEEYIVANKLYGFAVGVVGRQLDV